ncbi:MAG: MBL fold metallo-hydrolase [Nitrososphaerota archaeon]|nr:MBL fold metallo-hydrolase [Candidatus Calditenuis fumarioli]
MVPVTYLGRNVYVIDNGGLGYDRTNATFVVRTSRGSIMIDTGYAVAFRRVMEGLRAIGIGRDELKAVLLTHVHLDHCGATPLILREFRDAVVVVHPRGARHLEDPSRLLEATKEIFGERVFSKMGGMEPVDGSRIVRVSDEEELEFGDVVLRALYTPGHAPHHVAYLLTPHRYVFAGDALATRGTVFKVPLPDTVPPGFDFEAGMRSIRRVFEADPRLVLITHYGWYVASQELMEEELELYRRWFERIRELKSQGLDRFRIAELFIREFEDGLRQPLHPVARDWIYRYVWGAYLGIG